MVTGPGVRVTRSGHCGGELGQCQVPPNVVVILDTDKSNTRTEKLDIKAPGGTQHSALTGECIPPPLLNFHSARQINYQKFNGPAKRYLMVINYIVTAHIRKFWYILLSTQKISVTEDAKT